jgi:hypothetical protein
VNRLSATNTLDYSTPLRQIFSLSLIGGQNKLMCIPLTIIVIQATYLYVRSESAQVEPPNFSHRYQVSNS